MEIEKIAKSHGKVMEFIFLQISLAIPLRNEKSWKSHGISSPDLSGKPVSLTAKWIPVAGISVLPCHIQVLVVTEFTFSFS